MKNPFKKAQPAKEGTFVHDGISVMLNNTISKGNMEEVDIVELFDENGDSMVFEVLANAAYLGNKYFITTVYLEEEPETDENGQKATADVYVLKEVFVKSDSMLEPVEDMELVNKIFDAFRKAAGDRFDYK